MIYLIIKSYFTLLIAVGSAASGLFILGLYCFLKKPASIEKNRVELTLNSPKISISNRDIQAIAGDDVLATQLDLARAYVEANRINLAKKILAYVMQHGSKAQQQEAKVLAQLCE